MDDGQTEALEIFEKRLFSLVRTEVKRNRKGVREAVKKFSVF